MVAGGGVRWRLGEYANLSANEDQSLDLTEGRDTHARRCDDAHPKHHWGRASLGNLVAVLSPF